MPSSLDVPLSEWRGARRPPSLHRPSRTEMLAGRRRVERRVEHVVPAEGRWSTLYRYAVLGPALDGAERALAQTRQALQCYGILSRDTLEGQRGLLPWAALYPHLYRMVLTGEVRRGFFAQGRSGLQFALSDALDSLRRWVRADAPGRDALLLLNATDPAMVYGGSDSIIAVEGDVPDSALQTDGLVVSRMPSNYVVLSNGVPVLVYEHGGGRWRSTASLQRDVLEQAVSLVLAHLTRPGGLAHSPARVPVNSWNGQSPLGTETGAVLAALGFRRDTPGMVWDGLQRRD